MAVDATTLSVLLPWRNKSDVIGNDTLDVIRKGCFDDYNTIACIRNGFLACLAVITGLLCVLKVIQLHVYKHSGCHQYTIFYCAILQCAISGVYWIIGRHHQLDFIAHYLKLIQFLILCHFYWVLATRVTRKERLNKAILVPMLTISWVYFTTIVILGVVNEQTSWLECLQLYWIELSTVELFLVQLFMVAAVYITRRLNEISTLDSVRWQQKRDLWCIVIVFEVSAFSAVVYNCIVQILGDEVNGCSGIFLHIQELYSPVYVVYSIITLLLPIWVMLVSLRPTPVIPDQDDLLPGQLSEDGTYASIFSQPDLDQQYRQLYHPTDCYQSVENSPPGATSAPPGVTSAPPGATSAPPGATSAPPGGTSAQGQMSSAAGNSPSPTTGGPSVRGRVTGTTGNRRLSLTTISEEYQHDIRGGYPVRIRGDDPAVISPSCQIVASTVKIGQHNRAFNL